MTQFSDNIKSLSLVLVNTEKTVWGPVFWNLLHNSAMNGELTEKGLADFAEAIICPICKSHFKDLLVKVPFGSIPGPFTYTWILHNLVNASVNHPIMSLEEAKSLYS